MSLTPEQITADRKTIEDFNRSLETLNDEVRFIDHARTRWPAALKALEESQRKIDDLFDTLVAIWHDGHDAMGDTRELPEFLGMTEQEYFAYLSRTTPKTIEGNAALGETG